MTTGRRLDHLEEGLPPKAGVLLWLEEAHAHGSLTAYCGWLVDRPTAEAPLARLRDQALDEVRGRLRNASPEQSSDAAQQAERDVAFLVELVLVLNTSAEEMLQFAGLRCGMLHWERRAISAEARDEGPDPHAARQSIAARWARWGAAVSALRLDLHVHEEARGLLEARYLDGHLALFPETLERWARLREAVDALASHDGSDTVGVPGPDPDPERVAVEAERLVGWARARALDILGDLVGATTIVGRWLGDDDPAGGS